jgi:hypothetical protein
MNDVPRAREPGDVAHNKNSNYRARTRHRGARMPVYEDPYPPDYEGASLHRGHLRT